MQRLSVMPRRTIKLVSISVFTLMLCIIFSNLVHQVLDWALVNPVLSSVSSSLWTDISLITGFTLVTYGVLMRKNKEFKPHYILQSLIVVVLGFYFYHRIEGSRYVFTPFSFLPYLCYADLLVLLAVIYLIILNYNVKKIDQGLVTERNRNAQNVIKSYLSQNTNYALLINGKRGTGKTYFVKNTVQPMIDSLAVYGQQVNNYQTILISLYGVKKIDEIYFQLAINIKPYLKHLSVPSGSVLARILSRGLLNLSGVGSIEEFVGDIKRATQESAKLSGFVLVFDDLDRMAEGFSIQEFIGFVNSLVEHENNKVLIITDELKIEQKKLYAAAKEKSIGRVIDFPNDFKSSVKDIITNRYNNNIIYLEFLKLLEPDIFRVFRNWQCDNLRTLIYFLNHFEQIFLHIHSLKDDSDLRLSKLKDAAEYCMIFSVEFSRGAISFTSPHSINEPGRVNSYLTLQMQVSLLKADRAATKEGDIEAPPTEKPYIQGFAQKFSSKNLYFFYQSIFDYVTGGNELDKKLLSEELQENITDRMFKPSEEDLAFQQLSYPIYLDWSIEYYLKLSKKMMRFALEGKYPLRKYVEIYHMLTRFPQIKEWPTREIASKLVESMERNKDFFQHDSKLDFQHRHANSRDLTYEEKDISKAIFEINNALGVRDSIYRRKNLFSSFIEAPDKFYETCNDEYVHKAVFDTWDFPSFFEAFRALKPSEVLDFCDFFRSRYSYLETTEWVEYEFISELLTKLRSFEDENREFTFRQYVEDELTGLILDFIKRYAQASTKSQNIRQDI